jgi:quinol monooxygenase YgiN
MTELAVACEGPTSLPFARRKDAAMTKLALYVPLEAKAGKEEEAAEFLRSALPLVQEEPGTTTWYAVRFDHNSFAIFDAFPDEAARDAHLAGKVAVALMQRAPDLFVDPPEIKRLDILAFKQHAA